MSTLPGAEEEFADLLRRFEDAVRRTGAGVARLLAPGLPEKQVRSELRNVGMEPPGELVTWFGWHNGLTQPTVNSWGDGLLVSWLPLSLQESVQDWGRKDLGTEPWSWLPTWLPIGLSGGAARLAVNCAPPQQELAVVRMVEPEAGLFDELRVPSVRGLAVVVRWWVDALERGHLRYDPERDGWDLSRESEIPHERRRTGLV